VYALTLESRHCHDSAIPFSTKTMMYPMKLIWKRARYIEEKAKQGNRRAEEVRPSSDRVLISGSPAPSLHTFPTRSPQYRRNNADNHGVWGRFTSMITFSVESDVAMTPWREAGRGGMSVCGIRFFHSPLSSGQGGHAMQYSQAYGVPSGRLSRLRLCC
jgi:hypothetical protein